MFESRTIAKKSTVFKKQLEIPKSVYGGNLRFQTRARKVTLLLAQVIGAIFQVNCSSAEVLPGRNPKTLRSIASEAEEVIEGKRREEKTNRRSVQERTKGKGVGETRRNTKTRNREVGGKASRGGG